MAFTFPNIEKLRESAQNENLSPAWEVHSSGIGIITFVNKDTKAILMCHILSGHIDLFLKKNDTKAIHLSFNGDGTLSQQSEMEIQQLVADAAENQIPIGPSYVIKRAYELLNSFVV